MSAIVSLLRVMTLRDADAITLESGKVPSLRRRGQVEPMAMSALDAGLVEDFVAPLVEEQALAAGPVMVTFADAEGRTYPVTVERTPTGIRCVVRRAAKAKPAPRLAATPGVAPVSRATPGTAPSASATISSQDDSPPTHLPAPAAAPVPAASSRHEARAALARLLAAPVAHAHAHGASDVLLSTGKPACVRVDGRIEKLDVHVDDDELVACARAFASEVGTTADLSLDLDGARVRVNVFDHLEGYALAARLIRDGVPSLDELGLPSELASIVGLRDGLVLVCGPTGSGKSTTLAALLEALDQRRAAHVITLEDPIEYRFRPQRCLVHQRELGTHIPTFEAGLRAALREAPDVILLGELRDRETIAAALTAADTGHLVLATLHAPSAAGAIDRVIDSFPEAQQRQVRGQLAACLRTIVTQYLLPRRDGGRAVAVELVPVTHAVAHIIRKGDLHTLPTAIQSGRDAGMIPLERSLARLLDSGAVAPKVVRAVAADHDLLHALAGRLR